MDEGMILTIDANTDDIYQQIVKKYFNDRCLILNQEVDDDAVENMALSIFQWNKEDKNLPIVNRKKINIYLHSDGGDVLTGNMLLSAIKISKTPVVTIGLGTCASMASYILAAGAERYCFPNTIILYHDGETGYISSGNKGKDIQNFYNKLSDYNTNFMIENTKMTKEFLEDIKDREYYMFPDEAKERGIVDKIIGTDCDIDEIL